MANSQIKDISELEDFLRAGCSFESASDRVIDILRQMDWRITTLEEKNERNESDGR